MKNIAIIISFLICTPGFGQEFTWFSAGQEWYYKVDCDTSPACGYIHYGVVGTEMIGGHEASVINRSEFQEWQSDPVQRQEYLRFENDTVWRYSTEAEAWHLLYDMGAQPGDVWTIQEDVFYGYEIDGQGAEDPPLFKVVVDSVIFLENVPGSTLENRRVIYTSGSLNQSEENFFNFGYENGAILEGVGPVGKAKDLIGNDKGVLIVQFMAQFQCFLQEGILMYGSNDSPCNILSTNDLVELPNLDMYPNPVNNILSIKTDAVFQQIDPLDIRGRRVSSLNPNQRQFDLSDRPSGLYILRLTTKGGIYNEKIVKR